MQADREIFYAHYGNTAVDLDSLPVSRARLTVVEPVLFEWDVFEMAAPIQSPAKCEVRSVIRFLNTKGASHAIPWQNPPPKTHMFDNNMMGFFKHVKCVTTVFCS